VNAIELAILVAATTRVIRLVQIDDAGRPARLLIEKLIRNRDRTDRLLECPFCIGFWISLTMASASVFIGHTTAWTVMSVTLALSWAAGHLTLRTDWSTEND
jgi:hypothetical protein